MEPTTAHTIEITLDGQPRTLKYGFRAFHELKLNPFKPSTLVEFFTELDVESAARFVRAGLLYEYRGKDAPRKGEEPPTTDDIIDGLDMAAFMRTLQEDLPKVTGADSSEDTTERTPDPPQA